MICREEALAFLNETLTNKNIIKHLIATESLMGAIYDFSEKRGDADLGIKEEWKLAGLLHDGDYLESIPVEKQGMMVSEMLAKRGFSLPETVKQAMAAHNFHNNHVEPKSKMDWTLFCGDCLTGLIVASTLVLPSRKLADLTPENVLNRFSEKRFAAGTRREDIALCEEKLGISLPEFVKIGVEALKRVSKEIEL